MREECGPRWERKTRVRAPALDHATAWADPDDGIHRSGDGRSNADQILDPTGSPDDDSDGDPDTAGDGFGYTDQTGLLGSRSAGAGDSRDGVWAEFILMLLNHIQLLR